MEDDDNVRTPSRMVDDDSAHDVQLNGECRRKGGVEARPGQGLYLRNELLAIIEKLPLPHHDEMTKWIYPIDITVFAINVALW